MAKLVVITKGLPASAFELGANWATIGRGDDNAFQIVEVSVSTRHCEVRLKGNELVVHDLLSTNGTFVGGKKIIDGVLKTGETLRVGEVQLRFDASPAAPTPGTSFVTKMLVTNTAASAAQKTAPAVTTPAPVPAQVTDAKPSETSGGEPTKKRHVLFVDDSMAFLETFGELCAALSNQTWTIYSATTADRALAILKDNPIALVVLDIRMPTLDGIQLLGIIHRRHPDVKVAVITGNANETNRAAALSNGAELFIEKPISADAIKVVFNMLNDLVSWEQPTGFSGALRQVGLQEVIQMGCIGRHSSILEIRNAQTRGQIYIETGVITHAAVGTLTGEMAFYKLLSLTGGEFHVKPFQAPPQRTVQGSWEYLLMEAARAHDEETAFIAATKPPAPNPPPAEGTSKAQPSAPATQDEHVALGDDIVVVATYDGKWNPEGGGKK
jgi:CheY-like chemotaxis protein